MIFDEVETTGFTRRLTELLSDEDYSKLQLYFAEFPDSGDIIQGGGGIRKLRYALPGRGTRGGERNYWLIKMDTILMLENLCKK
jgi:hypothetical protein